jgi:hypothetical protein
LYEVEFHDSDRIRKRWLNLSQYEDLWREGYTNRDQLDESMEAEPYTQTMETNIESQA